MLCRQGTKERTKIRLQIMALLRELLAGLGDLLGPVIAYELQLIAEAQVIARRVQYIELTTIPDFAQTFARSMRMG